LLRVREGENTLVYYVQSKPSLHRSFSLSLIYPPPPRPFAFDQSIKVNLPHSPFSQTLATVPSSYSSPPASILAGSCSVRLVIRNSVKVLSSLKGIGREFLVVRCRIWISILSSLFQTVITRGEGGQYSSRVGVKEGEREWKVRELTGTTPFAASSVQSKKTAISHCIHRRYQR